jgi:hypothetical protein
MTATRPICEALSPAMRGALVDGHAHQPATACGLAARRMAAPGCSRLSLRLTPIGRQVAAMLSDLHTMRQALWDIERSTTDSAVYDLAMRALARTRTWVP